MITRGQHKITIEERLPGEVCDTLEEEYYCYEGHGECYNGRCMGFGRNQVCEKTAQCELGFYCDPDTLFCTVYLIKDEECNHPTSCGRVMRCVAQDDTLVRKCTEYFSIEDGKSKDTTLLSFLTPHRDL